MVATGSLPTVNNSFYEDLGDRWYEAWDDPVALLRAEGRLKNPWVAKRIAARFQGRACRVLDVGCGAGFLANSLALSGHQAVGVDLSRGSLKVARSRDATRKAAYGAADAYRLPFADASFEAVAALDLLEHVEHPERVVAEAARLLKPGGLFFFHTFNRNFPAWLIVIKGLEWFVRNTPPRMHVISMFIKPQELAAYCARNGLEVVEMTGMRPEVGRWAFWKMLLTRRVPRDYAFRFTRSLRLSYIGMAVKSGKWSSKRTRSKHGSVPVVAAACLATTFRMAASSRSKRTRRDHAAPRVGLPRSSWSAAGGFGLRP